MCIILFLHKPSVLLQSVCSLHTFLLRGPINLDLRYFVAKSVIVIYAFFGVNFILQKFCLCKKNDKYEVCKKPTKSIRAQMKNVLLHASKNAIVDILDVTSEKYALFISSQMFQLENGSALLVDSEINILPILSDKELEEVANVLQI